MGGLEIITRKDLTRLSEFDYRSGAMVCIDKPLGWTSFQVVNKLRYVLSRHVGVKRLKVGHAGTLDPLASGLLLICTGKGTKQIQSFMGQEKEYLGELTLGATTPSYDLETTIDQTYPTEHLSPRIIGDIASDFIGEILQHPPIFSAKKRDGRRAYDSARAGKEIELAACPVTIHELEFNRIEMPQVEFRVRCGKGTYIRSLAHDIGKALKSGAYLSALKRTAIGQYDLEDALSVEEFCAAFRSLESP